jgi:hypothetical protein
MGAASMSAKVRPGFAMQPNSKAEGGIAKIRRLSDEIARQSKDLKRDRESTQYDRAHLTALRASTWIEKLRRFARKALGGDASTVFIDGTAISMQAERCARPQLRIFYFCSARQTGRNAGGKTVSQLPAINGAFPAVYGRYTIGRNRSRPGARFPDFLRRNVLKIRRSRKFIHRRDDLESNVLPVRDLNRRFCAGRFCFMNFFQIRC